ncbi:uncharacterized protein DNG_04179 [Cephalotrichum gorgonifer]|uniref:DUF2169 domain-containing protein n=1 Tax=Cephalotrichum gorgonifer TaxID=2041049 RepID=A0AAE8MW10_9PEZI|nr:uncharacterized protein DNG_04179 [Cephalotrichum gorgonifer]
MSKSEAPAIQPYSPTLEPQPSISQQRRCNWKTWCALLSRASEGSFVAADPVVGIPDIKIGATVHVARTGNSTVPWMGFKLAFPLGNDGGQAKNVENGFGTKYTFNGQYKVPMKTSNHVIEMRLPRNGLSVHVDEAPCELWARFPKPELLRRGLSLVTVYLADGAEVNPVGYGMPYANGDDKDLEEWVNGNKPIVDGITLQELMALKKFVFAVPLAPREVEKEFNPATLPPRFEYPHLKAREWNEEQMWQVHLDTLGKEAYHAARSYENDETHVAVTANAVSLDTLWLEREAQEIRGDSLPAYLAPLVKGETIDLDEKFSPFYAIISMKKEYRERHKGAWARLVREGQLKVGFETDIQDDQLIWSGTIVNYPKGIKALADQPIDDDEIVIRVDPSKPQFADGKDLLCAFQAKAFGSRAQADAQFKEDETH